MVPNSHGDGQRRLYAVCVPASLSVQGARQRAGDERSTACTSPTAMLVHTGGQQVRVVSGLHGVRLCTAVGDSCSPDSSPPRDRHNDHGGRGLVPGHSIRSLLQLTGLETPRGLSLPEAGSKCEDSQADGEFDSDADSDTDTATEGAPSVPSPTFPVPALNGGENATMTDGSNDTLDTLDTRLQPTLPHHGARRMSRLRQLAPLPPVGSTSLESKPGAATASAARRGSMAALVLNTWVGGADADEGDDEQRATSTRHGAASAEEWQSQVEDWNKERVGCRRVMYGIRGHSHAPRT